MKNICPSSFEGDADVAPNGFGQNSLEAVHCFCIAAEGSENLTSKHVKDDDAAVAAVMCAVAQVFLLRFLRMPSPSSSSTVDAVVMRAVTQLF